MANLTKCIVCGKKYNYCPNCANTHGWRFYTDTHEHYQIYMTLNQYVANQISKDEAISNFERIGINADTDLSDIKPHIADQIKQIVTVPEKTVLRKTKKSKLYSEDE